MSDKQEKRYLYINGQAVSVSEQVYQAYHHYERKEYFTYDLKAEQFTCDQEAQTATFTPSREDSYERLLAAKTQFPNPASAPSYPALQSSVPQRTARQKGRRKGGFCRSLPVKPITSKVRAGNRCC